MEWIPIEREAPKDGQKILVCYEDGTILGTRYNPRSISTWLAWMPQPKPYTADTPQTDCDKCIWNVCNYNKVEWDADTPQTDCPWE